MLVPARRRGEAVVLVLPDGRRGTVVVGVIEGDVVRLSIDGHDAEVLDALAARDA